MTPSNIARLAAPKSPLQRIAEARETERDAQVTAALGILALAAETAEQLTEGADVLDRLPGEARTEMERTASVLAGAIARIKGGIGRAR